LIFPTFAFDINRYTFWNQQKLFSFQELFIFHRVLKTHTQFVKSRDLFQFNMLIVAHLNLIYCFRKVYQHLKLAGVRVKLHLLFFVFKHLLIILHSLLPFFHQFNFNRLYINSKQVLLSRNILFLPSLLSFLSQIFSFKDLRYRLTSL
jgi:hypothetical protein